MCVCAACKSVFVCDLFFTAVVWFVNFYKISFEGGRIQQQKIKMVLEQLYRKDERENKN